MASWRFEEAARIVATRAVRRCIPSCTYYLVVDGILPPLGMFTQLTSRRAGSGAVGSVVSDVLMVVVIVMFIGALLASGYRTERRKARAREAAAQGDSARVPLADHQPDLNLASARLPLTIRLRPRWSRVVATAALFPVVMELIGLVVGLVRHGNPFGAFALLLPGVIIGVPGIGLLMYLAARMRIEATEEGLSVSREAFGNAERMRWDEARLFAISPDKRLGSPCTYYELADSRTVVKWVRLPRSSHFSLLDAASLSKPTTSFEEYDRQMDALHGLIAAKTGLSLYDLRRARPETG